MRIATITLAAPFPEGFTGFMWNVNQPKAINEIGHRGEVFAMSLWGPRFLERWFPKLKRYNDRPAKFEFHGVTFHIFKGIMPPPVWVRWNIANRFPRLAGRLICWSIESRLLKALREYKPDALLVHDTIINGDLGIRLARRLGIPFGTIDHDPIDMPPDSPLGRHFKRIGDAARVVFNVGQIGYLHNRDALKLSNARLLPNGTASPTEEQRRTPRPARWDGKKVVLCVGAFIERKAHKELLRAFAEVNIPDTVLVITGDPPQHIRDLVAELKLQDKVEFVPNMPLQELQQYMVWADLFCLPSWWECAALVYVEAMMAETPPIMTTDCGLVYTVDQGRNGWAIPPKDHGALVEVLREALTRSDLKAMGKRGRETVEGRFTWRRNAELVIKGLNGEPDPLPGTWPGWR